MDKYTQGFAHTHAMLQCVLIYLIDIINCGLANNECV